MTNGADSDTVAWLIGRLGAHPLSGLGGDEDGALFRWLLMAVLMSARAPEGLARDAVAALARRGLDSSDALASDAGGAASAVLEACGVGRAAQVSARLVRVARGLEAAGGSLGALGREALDLEGLAGALGALGPGLGAAAVGRFLAPLRARFPAAAELPVEPAAVVAGVHLGWLPEGSDGESALPALRRCAAGALPPVDAVDLEWALGRLGRLACTRNAARRCPVLRCPLREGAPSADSRAPS